MGAKRVFARRFVIGFAFAIIAYSGSAFAGASPSEIRPAETHLGQTFRDCSECPEMVTIPPGGFLMGAPDGDMDDEIDRMGFLGKWLARSFQSAAQPQHGVHIGKAFAIGKYDVTVGEFTTFVKESGYVPRRGCVGMGYSRYSRHSGWSWDHPGFQQTDRDPVVCVEFKDMQAYIAWLNRKVSALPQAEHPGFYRLPSEAEWEYTAWASQVTRRWWGDAIGSGTANCKRCGSPWDNRGTAPAGSFPPNPFGVSDMLGDVWQMTNDCWHKNYANAPTDGSAWERHCWSSHVERGGDWRSDTWVLRPYIRTNFDDEAINFVGFRVLKEFE